MRNIQPDMKRIGIVGATGYTGEELLRVLSRHPHIEVAFASEIESGKPLKQFFPNIVKFGELVLCSTQDAIEQQVDLVFLCLPAIESAKVAKSFFDRNVKVIDLGADFRFDESEEYKKWYDIDHPVPDLLRSATYGLPEWNRQAIRTAQIVGNPGCYPTSVLLAMIPFMRAGLVADHPIIIDAKSGVSGAGKAPTRTTHYIEANENVNAYKPGRVHRHVGEMEQELSKQCGGSIKVIFTPHLVPMSRGLYASIYFKLTRKIEKLYLLNLLTDAYADEPFVHVLQTGLPTTKLTSHSNFCFLGVETVDNSDYAMVFSAIDNLGKGASWQAVQNMNLMLGFPEETGLSV